MINLQKCKLFIFRKNIEKMKNKKKCWKKRKILRKKTECRLFWREKERSRLKRRGDEEEEESGFMSCKNKIEKNKLVVYYTYSFRYSYEIT